ncbi:MAG: hypothetical protein COY80_02910 [Candidatus Pacebacteria bacterium CG_4_10_14_0_8_um_filter_42_14]|nr:MAG: hypothetical protein COY80_02910 [Candidatus Pacebacteria bacterium CG_4_10_14_0_8_um_filter_42_14]
MLWLSRVLIMAHLLERMQLLAFDMKQKASLLPRADKVGGVEFLVELLLKEADEFEEALNSSDAKDDQLSRQLRLKKIRDELNDVLVFMFSVSMIHPGEDVDVAGQVGKADLYKGGKSYAVDWLRQAVLDVQDGSKASLQESFARWYAISEHLENPHLALRYFRETINKVLANRPPEIFSDIENGKVLSNYECVEKYKHVSGCMRLIRDRVKESEGRDRQLKRSDWIHLKTIILDWRNPDLSMALLRSKLPQVVMNPGGVLVYSGLNHI